MTENEIIEKLKLFKTVIEKLNEKKAELQLNLDESLKTIEEDKDLIKSSEEKIDILSKDKESFEEKIKELSLNNENILNENKQLLIDLQDKESLKNDLDKSNIKIQELNSIIDSMNKEMVGSDKINELESEKELITNQLNEMTNNYDSLSSKYDLLINEKQNWSSKEDELAQLKSEKEQLDQLLNNKELTMNNMQNSFNEEIQKKQTEIRTIQEEVELLKKSLLEIEAKNKEQEQKISELNELLTIKSSNEESLKEKVLNISKELDSARNSKVEVSKKPVESETNGDMYPYRFGHVQESIKNQFVEFVNGLYDGIDDVKVPYELNSIDSAAARSKISDKTKKVFVKRLYEMISGGKPLIYDKDNHIYSTFTRDYIIDFATTIVR